VVMDATGAGFHAAVGDLEHAHLRAEHGIGGPPHLLEHLAQLIADHPTGPNNQTRQRNTSKVSCSLQSRAADVVTDGLVDDPKGLAEGW
jgi:hypothetical protein